MLFMVTLGSGYALENCPFCRRRTVHEVRRNGKKKCTGEPYGPCLGSRAKGGYLSPPERMKYVSLIPKPHRPALR